MLMMMMANNHQSSSSHPIDYSSFNQDNSCFAIGTRHGFKVFDCNTGRLLYERVVGAFNIVEMLYRSSLLAIAGAAVFITEAIVFVSIPLPKLLFGHSTS